jgi:hypothetical protein
MDFKNLDEKSKVHVISKKKFKTWGKEIHRLALGVKNTWTTYCLPHETVPVSLGIYVSITSNLLEIKMKHEQHMYVYLLFNE